MKFNELQNLQNIINDLKTEKQNNINDIKKLNQEIDNAQKTIKNLMK